MAGQGKLRPEIALLIVNARREGKSISECARLTNVSKTSLHNWLAAGAKHPNSTWGVFARAMDRAVQLHVQTRVDLLTVALLQQNPEYAAALKSNTSEEMEVV